MALRLARRQAWRTKMSSLLIGTLVALPIAAMTAYVVIAASMIGTPEEKARVELGRMQAWVAPAGVADAGFWQLPSDPTQTGYPIDDTGTTHVPDGSPSEDPLDALPTGTVVVPITDSSTLVRTATGRASMPAVVGEAWDPRLEGAFQLVSGRAPTRTDEALVTPSALTRLGIAVGGTLEMIEPARSVTVVGTMRDARLASKVAEVFLPRTAASPAPGTQTRWYLPDTTLSWDDVRALNRQGIVAYSRDVVLDPPTWRPPVPADWGGYGPSSWWAQFTQTMLLLLIGAAFAGYVVVMLAGAAFAVAARRQ